MIIWHVVEHAPAPDEVDLHGPTEQNTANATLAASSTLPQLLTQGDPVWTYAIIFASYTAIGF